MGIPSIWVYQVPSGWKSRYISLPGLILSNHTVVHTTGADPVGAGGGGISSSVFCKDNDTRGDRQTLVWGYLYRGRHIESPDKIESPKDLQARIQDFLQGGGGGTTAVYVVFFFFCYTVVKKFVEKKNWWSRAGGGGTTPNPPPLDPRLIWPIEMLNSNAWSTRIRSPRNWQASPPLGHSQACVGVGDRPQSRTLCIVFH